MKKILVLFTYLLALACILTSCENDVIDPLSGKYPIPENYTLNKVLVQNVQKNEKSRTFTLTLSTDGLNGITNGTGDYLMIEFIGSRNNYFLVAGAYTAAANASSPATGTYIPGQDNASGTYWYSINNGAVANKLKVREGRLDVAKNGDTYTISGLLMLEDKSILKIAYSGSVIFPEDPPVYTYSLEVQKTYAWTADGTNYTPVAGSQLNKFTVFADGSKTAYIEIVTAENPASLSGTYPVSGEIRDANGAVVQGIYMDLSAYVPGWIIEGGSYLYDGENQYISAGNISIVDKGGILTFTSSNLSIVDKATGGVKPEIQSMNYVDASQ
ncbi:hypothetical protein FACS189428_2040 [Clostridia bacterium]|nr:hypothetical protein FACS189428_2040 [Clostridia bacterium]